MPLNDDEMQKRRQRREALRKKREAEARRLRLRLILAAVVLALCAGGIFLLIRRLGGEGESVSTFQPQQPETQAAAQTTSPAQQGPITTIHIKAAGDLNVTDAVITAGLSATGYDYTGAFKDVAGVLSDADLTVLNLEGNICGEPYGTGTTSAPAELLQGLRYAGVDLIQMANSCAINNGLNGLNTTLRAIRTAGLEPVGAYANAGELAEGKGYTMVDIRGIRIAFVAFTKGLGGRGMPAGNEDLVNLLYEDYATTYEQIDRDRINSILKNVEAEKPDLTVALLHWGSEYNDEISKTQDSIVTLMQKAGVDVIIGTHPHLVQKIDYDPITGNFVAYSLGDFFGDATRAGTNYSIILDLEITKDSTTGVTKVTGYSMTPIYTVKTKETAGDYSYSRVMRIESALSAYYGNFLDKVTASTSDAMEYSLVRIEERTSGKKVTADETIPTETTVPPETTETTGAATAGTSAS